MKIRGVFICFISTLLVLLFSYCIVAQTPTSVTINVHSGARQTFSGFGTSQLNQDNEYNKLTQVQRKLLNQFVWRNAKFKVLRLWFFPENFAPALGQQNIDLFVKEYISSGMIADAKANGCTTLLLAPSGIPPYMSSKAYILDSHLDSYANLIADFILKIKKEYNISINATGILNEPNDRLIGIRLRQWPVIIKKLRNSLDLRGLKSVKIVTPELANVDRVANDYIDAIKADSSAWSILSGIATHSYNMAANNDMVRRIEGTGKEYWVTEAGANGSETLGDAVSAASTASRVLNDLNHYVTHWLWFLGYVANDPNDDQTRLIRYSSKNSFSFQILQKYYYLQQLSGTFDGGAVFRVSTSSLEGDMNYTYGKKPQITVATARNPDGTWGIGISNYTSDYFSNSSDQWIRQQGGYKAKTFNVTIIIKELANSGNLTFYTRRSNSNINNINNGTVTMQKGRVTVYNVSSLDLITLRSSAVNR